MNKRQLVSLFFGLGFLVLAAGIFSTQSMNNNQGNTGIQPQTINQNRTNVTPNPINDTIPNDNLPNNNNMQNNKIDTNNSVEKIKAGLDNIDGVDNVDAVVSKNCALVSCTVSEDLRNQKNYKEILTNKVKEIDPNLVTVYVMENQDMQNMDFNSMSEQFMNMSTNDFNSVWQNITNTMTKK